jgi:predicted RNase H-like nuclease (RuvC/YqgF family)
VTHINPLKEIVHKQENIIENHEQKMCKQFIQINTLERTIKDQSLAINEHEAELESLQCKLDFWCGMTESGLLLDTFRIWPSQ